MDNISNGDQMNVVEEVKKIVSQVTSAAHPTESETLRVGQAIAAFPGVDARDLLRSRYNEYEIGISLGDRVREELEILAWARRFDIAAAPEVAAVFPTSDGNVLVRRYWACPDEQLLPVKSTEVTFRASARDRFRRDLEVLAEHDRVHPYVRSYHHWYVGETSGCIVLNSWAAVTAAEPGEAASLLAVVDKLLARRAGP